MNCSAFCRLLLQQLKDLVYALSARLNGCKDPGLVFLCKLFRSGFLHVGFRLHQFFQFGFLRFDLFSKFTDLRIDLVDLLSDLFRSEACIYCLCCFDAVL